MSQGMDLTLQSRGKQSSTRILLFLSRKTFPGRLRTVCVMDNHAPLQKCVRLDWTDRLWFYTWHANHVSATAVAVKSCACCHIRIQMTMKLLTEADLHECCYQTSCFSPCADKEHVCFQLRSDWWLFNWTQRRFMNITSDHWQDKLLGGGRGA